MNDEEMSDEKWVDLACHEIPKLSLAHVALKWRKRALKSSMRIGEAVEEFFDGAVSGHAKRDVASLAAGFKTQNFDACVDAIASLEGMPSCDVGERARGSLRLLSKIIESTQRDS